MNLKEAFRYQSFLDSNMRRAMSEISRSNCLKTTKTHHKNKANPDAEDVVEVVEHDSNYVPGDAIVKFMLWLVKEREELSMAITDAKAALGFDIDAAVEANKFRQRTSGAIKSMLEYTRASTTTQGRDYKFNVEGNQTPYVYDIDVLFEPEYDVQFAKKTMRDMVAEAERVSTEIDRAMVNSEVKYEPKFDVFESFGDIIETFCEHDDAVEAQ